MEWKDLIGKTIVDVKIKKQEELGIEDDWIVEDVLLKFQDDSYANLTYMDDGMDIGLIIQDVVMLNLDKYFDVDTLDEEKNKEDWDC